VFERYREADVAVEECEHQLQDLNIVSVRTQRPLKLLFKPHNFTGGSYISESTAGAAATAAGVSTTVRHCTGTVAFTEASEYRAVSCMYGITANTELTR
jgi:hypothetical protein